MTSIWYTESFTQVQIAIFHHDEVVLIRE